MPNNAEKVLLTTRGTDLISKLLKMQQLEDDDVLAYSSRLARVIAEEFKERTVENIKDPLYRYFEREVSCGARLLQTVVSDLQDVLLICQGEKKQTSFSSSNFE